MKHYIFLGLVSLVVLSCKSKQMATEVEAPIKEEVIEKPIEIKPIYKLLCDRTWTHAREQSTDGNALYLNAEGKTFPPSRYRNSFEFNPDGTCRFMYLSPTDRHIMIDGKYSLEDDLLTIFTVDGQEYKKFTFLKLDGEEMLLRSRTIEN